MPRNDDAPKGDVLHGEFPVFVSDLGGDVVAGRNDRGADTARICTGFRIADLFHRLVRANDAQFAAFCGGGGFHGGGGFICEYSVQHGVIAGGVYCHDCGGAIRAVVKAEAGKWVIR